MKILSFDCHEALLCMFSNIDAEFDLIKYQERYNWRDFCRPVPKNINILNKFEDEVDVGSYDLILLHNYWNQYDRMKKYDVRKILYPAINEPVGSVDNNTKVVYCGFEQRRLSGGSDEKVIWYGIDTDEFKGYKGKLNRVLTMVHDFRERASVSGYIDWIRNTEGINADNWGTQIDGLNCPVADDYEEVKRLFRDYSVYYDPTTSSPMSFAVLEAMATGMPLVTTPHDDHPYFIKNNENGIISKDHDYIKDMLAELLYNKKMRNRIGSNARQTIKDQMSIGKFVDEWSKLIWV